MRVFPTVFIGSTVVRESLRPPAAHGQEYCHAQQDAASAAWGGVAFTSGRA